MTSSTPMPALLADRPAAIAEPLHERWVKKLFVRLTAQLGAKMADLYAGVKHEAVHDEWAQGLAGFTGEEIDRGLKACARRAFAPTLGEFTVLCRPALDAEIAWLEAAAGLRQRDAGQMGEWTHPAVFRAAQEMSFELRNKSFKECRKSWGWHLEREFAKGWGEAIPAPALRIEKQEAPRRGPTAEERAALASLFKRTAAQLVAKGEVAGE